MELTSAGKLVVTPAGRRENGRDTVLLSAIRNLHAAAREQLELQGRHAESQHRRGHVLLLWPQADLAAAVGLA